MQVLPVSALPATAPGRGSPALESERVDSWSILQPFLNYGSKLNIEGNMVL